MATSISERKKVYSQMQSILARRVPWVFVVQPRLMIAHQKWITNVSCGTQTSTGVPWDNPLFNAARWSFSSERN
jgi:ABC-type transport system substrate-binding protein